ncbi:MAG TPA: beta-ketoacyl synthase chain length factor, partial [Paraburkholderia sp.]|nr:beta-ketoacyl synthase chain length factor [Paraburkholderia sp.]
SPTAFSLSVLNAMTGIFGIARGDRSAASAISSGAETLGYALLEAYAQYAAQPDTPVLLVYADEPADAAYGAIEDEVQGGAMAILVDETAATGQLMCTRSDAAAASAADAKVAPAPEQASEARQPERFASQSQALQHCLDTGQSAVWQGVGTIWHWSWHERAA